MQLRGDSRQRPALRLLLVTAAGLAAQLGVTFIAPAPSSAAQQKAHGQEELDSKATELARPDSINRRSALLPALMAAASWTAGPSGVSAKRQGFPDTVVTVNGQEYRYEVRQPSMEGYEGAWKKSNIPTIIKLPRPSRNPRIYMMQKAAWSKEAEDRLKIYLLAMRQRVELEHPLQTFYTVHWGSEGDNFDRWDIYEREVFKQANEEGHFLLDRDLTDEMNNLVTYVYTSEKDREYCQKNFAILDLVELPDELKAYLKAVRITPFPPFPGVYEADGTLKFTNATIDPQTNTPVATPSPP